MMAQSKGLNGVQKLEEETKTDHEDRSTVTDSQALTFRHRLRAVILCENRHRRANKVLSKTRVSKNSDFVFGSNVVDAPIYS